MEGYLNNRLKFIIGLNRFLLFSIFFLMNDFLVIVIIIWF